MSEGREYWQASVMMTTPAQALHSATSITAPYEGNALDLTLFVYCRNQESSVIATLETIIEAMRISERSYEMVIIDDASTDGSVTRLREFVGRHEELNLVLCANQYQRGRVANYIDAAFIGCGKYFRWVDGDDGEPLETMVEVFRALGEADIIAPYFLTSQRGGKPGGRFAALINLVSGQRLNHYNGMAVHLRYNVMRWPPMVSGFGFQADMMTRLLSLGFTCKQLPCRDGARSGWRSNEISLHNFGAVALTLWVIVVRRFMSRRK